MSKFVFKMQQVHKVSWRVRFWWISLDRDNEIRNVSRSPCVSLSLCCFVISSFSQYPETHRGEVTKIKCDTFFFLLAAMTALLCLQCVCVCVHVHLYERQKEKKHK